MQQKMLRPKIVSLITMGYYNRIIDMDLQDMEDSQEYLECIDKLKELVKIENEEYSLITEDTIKEYFATIKGNNADNLLEQRMYKKLNERIKIYEGVLTIGNDISLSSIISSKLIIDIMKDIDKKIASLDESEHIDYEDIMMLKLYNKRYKYHYLTDNNYIENIALKYKFDINNIPRISFSEIEEVFNIKFIDKIQNIFLNYVIESMDELSNLQSNDKHLLMYSSIFEVARIKVMLPHLNKQSIDKLMLVYDDCKYKYMNNSALAKVRKLIKKRKEEFSE